MRWDDVVKSTVSVAAATSELQDIFRSPETGVVEIRLAGSKEHTVPCLDYTVVSDNIEDEIWAPCVVQWDMFCLRMEDLARAARVLDTLFNHDVPVTVAGVYMWSEFVDGQQLVAPDLHGYYGRGVRYRFTPIRREYLRQQ